jgi:hypothetical protein
MNADDSTKLALEHARSLFIYHAGQRIESLNRYFVTITVFLTGFGVLATSKLELGDRALFGLVLACGGFFITHLFKGLDKRNHQLVQCDESLLVYAEEKMAKLSNPLVPAWEVTKAAAKHREGVPHYTTIVPSIFRLYMAVSILGGIYFAWPWVQAALAGRG